MHYEYITEGTCSKKIEFDLIDGKVKNVSFLGGCNGNLKAISSLVDGMTIDEVSKKCKGIKCGIKNTSCSDQLVQALESTIDKE